MVATGRLTTFPGRSRYQIIVDHLEPAGAGALMALLEERRKKLAAEGLFDAGRKKPIPYLPRVIGVVTSPTGAVIRDILHRLRDRFPRHVLVWPVRVQGEGAAEEVAAAVRGFNAIAPGGRIPRPDLLIVARGGGSIEDLWAFNEEVAVRAVAASRIPVISAVGHETDWTLIDHAADLRAPTPTGAAEMAVPVRAELLAASRELASRHELGAAPRAWRTGGGAICRALPRAAVARRPARPAAPEARPCRRPARALAPHRGREEARALSCRRLAAVVRRSCAGLDAARRERLHADHATCCDRAGGVIRQARPRLRVPSAAPRCRRASTRVLARHRERYAQVSRLFQTLQDTASPDAILARGFAIVLDRSGGTVRSPEQVATGDPLLIKVARGSVTATVTDGLKNQGEAARTRDESADQEPLL